ncbi:MAG: amino acid ABC transporter permease [Microbacterium sp.]
MPTTAAPSPTSTPLTDTTIVRRSHPEHYVTAVIVVAVLAWIGYALATNPKLQWGVFARYLFSPKILEGLWVTVQLSVLSMVIAVAVGFLMAGMRMSSNPVLRAVARGYVAFFRGLPLLVLLLVCFNLALFVPEFRLNLGIIDWSVATNELITGFSASIIGLALHESAFMAEIIRGGVLSVPEGQMEAALSVGMRRRTAMRKIVYPQTFRVIIPTVGNQFIMLLKASSMVAVIGGGDLLTNAQRIYGQNYAVIPLLIVVSFWYLVLVGLATFAQSRLEAHLAQKRKGGARQRSLTGEEGA